MKKNQNQFNLRLAVQIFFFVLIALISVNKTLSATGYGIPFLSTASLHALCPFGGVETFYTLLTSGVFIDKVQISSIILMILVFLLALFFGPVFCGWVCPLGSFQEWIGKIGKNLFKKRYNQFIPKKAHEILRFFRYFVLFWILFITARSSQLLFINIDPYHALFKFWTGTVAPQALIILTIIIISALFVERPWCKYACPYGALLGLFNKIRIFKLKRNPDSCVSCHKCSRVCPMKIDVCKNESVSNVNCISCMECTSSRNCPKSETLKMEIGRKNRKYSITLPVLSIIIVFVILGGIFTTMALGSWNTKSHNISGSNNGSNRKNQQITEANNEYPIAS